MKTTDTEEQLARLVGSLQQFLDAKGIKVEVTGKVLGRRRSIDRCPCGEMTKQRAQKRGHVCEAKEITE